MASDAPCHDGDPMTPTRATHLRRSEQGGVTILTVLGLLVLLTVLSFNLGKNSLRELTSTGTVWQATKASEAAEAGLDWFLLWTNKDNWGTATSQGRNTLVTAFQELNTTGTWQTATGISVTYPNDRNVLLRSTELDASSDMVLSNADPTYYLQKATGNVTVQSFDIGFRYLGDPGVAVISGAAGGYGNTAGTTTGRTGRNANLYQVVSRGKASVPIGTGTFIRYTTIREMYMTATP